MLPELKGLPLLRRRALIASAFAATAAIGLAACSENGSGASDAGGSDAGGSDGGGDALDAVQISDDLAAEPTVSFSAPLEISAPSARIIVPGDGEKIADGDHIIWRSMYVDAQSGETLQSWWQGAPASGVSVSADALGAEAHSFLTTVPLGSRFAMAGWQQDQSGQARALVQVADVARKIDPLRADGEPGDPSGDFPAVTLDENGAPKLDGKPEGDPPAETTLETLIVGAGEPTREGDYLTMQYTGWSWSDGKHFDSSWERGQPFGFTQGRGQVIAGWDQHLVDIPVGSQVMLVIPPKDAYGEEKNEQQPLAGQTLIFVIDVLDAARRHEG